MDRTILVPLDGSKLAEHALPPASAVARASGGSLVIAHVHHEMLHGTEPAATGSADIDDRLREKEREYAEGVANRARMEGVHVEVSMLEGAVVPALLEEARARKTSLIVMATHGYSGLAHAWLGSVADEMVRRSSVPIMLVRPRDGKSSAPDLAATGLRKLLVPLDGSALAEHALERAAALASLAGAEVVLVRVVEPVPLSEGAIALSALEQGRVAARLVEAAVADAREYLEHRATALRGRELEVRTEVLVSSQPAVAMLDFADRLHADLIVMSTHGRGGLAELLLGSMADKLLRGSSIPVMFVRPEVAAVAPRGEGARTPKRELIKLH